LPLPEIEFLLLYRWAFPERPTSGAELPVPLLIEPSPPGSLQPRMARAPITGIPLPFTISPALGIAVWVLIGKVSLEFLALVLAAALLGK
jgi:hypothetical protein